ncbi:hypothetical protein LCGC14_2740710 [marine sediment metagenome]|uniref:Lipoprotein n=1 Tax=marine sediment metagenome TaxID=412755 RepID=A0A0F9BDE1_9ZZZZ
MRRLFWSLGILVLLGACTAQQSAVVDLGVAKVRDGNDTTAKTLIATVCGMTVGAYNRLESPTDRRGVDLLCGGDGEDPLTRQDLQRFLDAQ